MKYLHCKIALLLTALLIANQTYALPANKKAPDFTLKSFSGENIRLAEQRGKILLVNFWATWCTPCRQEIPKLNNLHKKYSRLGASVWGINIDKNLTQAKSMANQLHIIYPVLHDSDQAVSKSYDLSAMPYTLLIDRNGVIKNIYYGYVSGYEDKYDADIRKLLRE